MANIHVGDTMTVLHFELESLQEDGSYQPDDLTDKEVVILVVKPDGTSLEWEATPNPDQERFRGRAEYALKTGDIDQPGEWTFQPRSYDEGFQRTYEVVKEVVDR